MSDNRSALGAYLDAIAKEPLLTPDEEISLGRLIRQAVELEGLERELTRDERRILRAAKRAKARFVRANLRLVAHVAKKYSNKAVFMDLLDLIQEASIGLMRAVELYDPERGYKFSTYAYWWIRQAITRGISQQERAIRRPSQVSEMASKLTKVRHEMIAKLGRAPTLDELCSESGYKRSELDMLQERGDYCYSLDAKIPGYETAELMDFLADPSSLDSTDQDDSIDLAIQQEELNAKLKLMDEREQELLKLRFGITDGHAHTYTEIAEIMGISRERTRQLFKRSLAKLQYQFAHSERHTVVAPEPAPPAPKAKPASPLQALQQRNRLAVLHPSWR